MPPRSYGRATAWTRSDEFWKAQTRFSLAKRQIRACFESRNKLTLRVRVGVGSAASPSNPGVWEPLEPSKRRTRCAPRVSPDRKSTLRGRWATHPALCLKELGYGNTHEFPALSVVFPGLQEARTRARHHRIPKASRCHQVDRPSIIE